MTIETLLQTLNVDYKTRHRDVRQGWLGLICPHCGKPGEYYLGVHTETLAANCWRCGKHRISDILRAFGASKQALASLFRDRQAVYRPDMGKQVVTGQYRPPQSVMLAEAPVAFRRYLERRLLDPEEIAELWGVQAVPPPSKYEWRLLIPAFTHGKPVSWTTRSINRDCPHSLRYLAASTDREMFPIRSLLYGADYCEHAIIVVEGPVDAWKIGPGAISTLGLTLSDKQIAAISKYPVRVIAFDNEDKPQKRAKALARRLSEHPGHTDVYRFSGKDAASSPRREIKSLRKRYI